MGAGKRRRDEYAAAIIIVLLTALSAGYSLVTPAGEAPDEPAHVEYIDRLIETRRLPSLAPIGRWHYESHQPPLDYLVSAGLSMLVNGGPVDLVARDPAVRTPPRHLEVREEGGGVERLRRLRLMRLFWLPCLLITLLAFLRTSGFSREVTMATLLTVGATPQLLWLAGVITNDVSLAFFCTLAMLALMRSMTSAHPPWAAIWLSLATLAALMTKASGVALLPAIAAGAGWCLASRRPRNAIAVILAGTAASLWWICFNLWRYDAILPRVPRVGGQELQLGNLIADPLWPLKVIATFWARFGWLNVSLPIAWYAFFAVVTLLVGFGLLLAFRTRPSSTAIALTLLATNAALQAIYLAAYDYQTQGRYLFPSIAAISLFLAAALERLPAKRRRVVLTALPLMMLAATATGIWWVGRMLKS